MLGLRHEGKKRPIKGLIKQSTIPRALVADYRPFPAASNFVTLPHSSPDASRYTRVMM